MRHLTIVAASFRITGVLLVGLSILALADCADTAFVMHRMPPLDAKAPLDIGTYGIIALLDDGARVLAWLVYALAGFASIILVALVIGAVIVLLLGLLIYSTGRALRRRASWARIVAVVLVLAFSSIPIVISSIRNDLAPPAALPIGFAFTRCGS